MVTLISKRTIFLIPLLLFFIIVIYFTVNLLRDPLKLPNMLIGEEVPYFSLPPIQNRDNKGFQNSDLINHISLVNVFGSWCIACKAEHPFLMKIKKANQVQIHGINWRETDRLSGPLWLKQYGDPYSLVGDDPKSDAAIAFGVTGAPETFLIDNKGVIRYKLVGPITQQLWDEVIWPMIEKLKLEKKG